MSEHEPPAKGHAVSHAPVAARDVGARPARSPADQAADTIVGFVRATTELGHAVDAVRAAYAANDLERWTEARAGLDAQLLQIDRDQARVRVRVRGTAGVAAQAQLDTAERALERHRLAAAQLTDAPLGFTPIAGEDELLAVFAAPVVGSAKFGFDAKEAALRARFQQLGAVERRVLAQRLQRPRPNDPIAAAFARLGAERRQRLLAQLATAAAARAVATRDAGTHEAMAAAPVADAAPLDARVRALLDAAEGDAIVHGFAELADGLDGTTRRALAQRLASYRPGSGDELAARVARLDSETQRQIGLALQRDGVAWRSTAPASRPPTDAASYFSIHESKFFDAIRDRLRTVNLPAPHRRLVWAGGGEALAAAFQPALNATVGVMNLGERLPELLYPVDPFEVIDRHRELASGRPGELVDGRPALGVPAWSYVAGQAIALEFERALRASLPRMGLRYVAQADDFHGAPGPEVLVASHPIDRIVARLVCDPDVVRFVKASRGATARADTDAPAAFKHGLRLVDVEWQGGRDPKLWNWVRVNPPDARPEEVSAALFERDGVAPTEYAYALLASPPFFRVPERWARDIPAARAHAPADGAMEPDDSALALADSSVADEAARAQAGTPVARVDRAQLAKALAIAHGQLRAVGARLEPWQLYHLVGPAVRWVDKRADAVEATPDATLGVWAAISRDQMATLFEATTGINEALGLAERSKIAPGSPAGRPIRDVLEAFAAAMGESHLRASAAARLEVARQRRAMLPVVLLERTLHENREAARDVASVGPAAGQGAAVGERAQASNRTLEAGALDVRARLVAGGGLDVTQLQSVAVATAEETLVNRLTALDARTGQLLALVQQAPASIADVQLRLEFPRQLGQVQAEARAILVKLRRDAHPPAIPQDPAAAQAAFASARRDAVDAASQAFAELQQRQDLAQLFQRVIGAVEDAHASALIADIVFLIGLSVATAGVGSYVGGLVRGSMLSHAAVDSLAFAQLAARARWVGAAANIGTDATLGALGQTAIFGGDTKLSFVENVMTSVLTLGALRPIQTAAGALGKLDDEARGLWKAVGKGKVAFVHTGLFTTEVLVGAGASYVAARIAHDDPPKTDAQAEGWALQGAAMAVGHFVARRTAGLQQRLERLGEHAAHLRVRAEAQDALARKLQQQGTSEDALLVLEEHAQIVAAEAALLRDPQVVARLRLDPAQVEALRAGNRAALDDSRSQEVATMKLRFHGLEPLAADGGVWAGTPAQIAAVIGEAGRAAKHPRSDEAPRHRIVDVNGRAITFVEIDAQHDLRPPTARAAGVAGPDLHSHIMGVADVDYFVTKLGGGSPLRAFEAVHATLAADPAAQKSAKHAWKLAQAARSKLQAAGPENAGKLEHIAERALTQMLAAGDGTPFDVTYRARELLVDKLVDPGGGSYRNFARDTLATLATEGIGYSEQSVGLDKLQNKFPEPMMRDIHAELAKAGKDVDVRFLAMLHTSALAGKVDPADAVKTYRALADVLARGDVIGIDVGAPEKHAFTAGGMDNFKKIYATLSAAARTRGRPLVLRPHVGEGYRDDAGANAAGSTAGGSDSQHAQLARKNLETLISTLEDMGYNPAKGAADGVIVRFGHATHADHGQMQRMAKLGIIVEANIGSNLITGSILTIEEHPLLFNLYYGVKTVLGTDGGGVMRTERRAEYERARDQIERFRSGEAKLDIGGRVISFQELSRGQQARFTMDVLQSAEDAYHRHARIGDTRDASRVERGRR